MEKMVAISSELDSCLSPKHLANEEQESTANTRMKDPNFEQDEGEFDLETDEIWKKVNESSRNNRNLNSGIQRSSSCRINRRSSFSSSSKKKKNQVLLEGYVNENNEDDLTRTKSLIDDDLDELKGCVDLGFGFSYDEIPELCNTLPALELCYSMSQKFLDEQSKSPEGNTPTVAETPIANWKISSPGDHPEDVKARLKYWAQAVACTVRLCS